MPFSEAATIINPTTQQPSGKSNVDDFSDSHIKKATAEIQAALNRSKQKAGI
ncbi:MAG: hypothetical protein ABGW96_01095 [Methylophilaceae bacterium]|jgi:hypothetical protein